MEQVKVACPCPGTPHESDTVGLRPKLGLRAGTIVQKHIIDAHKANEQAQADDDLHAWRRRAQDHQKQQRQDGEGGGEPPGQVLQAGSMPP